MTDEQQMIEAIKAGNADKVRDLIEKDIFLADAKADDGTSALLTAIYHGEEEIVDVILESGPTLTIHEAAAAGIDDRVEELIKGDRSLVDSYSHDGWTPLHLAVFFNQNQIAELLIEQGANVDAVAKNQQGVTPLHSALANKNVKIAKLLLHRGADPNAVSAAGYTPMHYVATHDLVEVGRILLERHVDIDAKTGDGRTALDIAREKGSERAVRMLTGED
jgi:ankyrin repeat protein